MTSEIRELLPRLLEPESKVSMWRDLGYEPHPGQVEFHNSPARFKLNTCGRRYGKTISGVRELSPLLLLPEGYIWVVAPTSGLAVKEFRVFQRDLRLLQRLGKVKLEKDVLDVIGGRYLLKAKNGITIEVRSMEKEDQMVGEGLVAVIMAEAARLKAHIWSELIRPTLTDYHGVAVFSTTPRGRNWYYDMVQKAEENADWETWTHPSWSNPVLYPGGENDPEILTLRQEMDPVDFDQEIAAEFVTHAGLVYQEFRHDTHVQRIDLIPDIPVHGWIDVGFNDPFVCLATQVHDGVVYVLDEYYRERMTPNEHSEILKEWFLRPEGLGVTPSLLWCDPRAPDAIKELKRGGWEAKAAPALDKRRTTGQENPVRVGVKAVKKLLREDVNGNVRMLVHPRCKMTIKEFGLYEWKNDEPDPKNNNHAMDAIRYGVLAEVARDRPSIVTSDDEDEEDLLGRDNDDDLDDTEEYPYDPDESFAIQRLRQREAERRKREKVIA